LEEISGAIAYKYQPMKRRRGHAQRENGGKISATKTRKMRQYGASLLGNFFSKGALSKKKKRKQKPDPPERALGIKKVKQRREKTWGGGGNGASQT